MDIKKNKDQYPQDDKPLDADLQYCEQENETQINSLINALSEKQWRIYNIAVGGGIGLLVSIILFFVSKIEAYSSLSYFLIIALVMLLPRFLAKRIARHMDIGRYAMAGVIALFVLIELGRYLVNTF